MIITAKKINEKACLGAELWHFQFSRLALAISLNLNTAENALILLQASFLSDFLACGHFDSTS